MFLVVDSNMTMSSLVNGTAELGQHKHGWFDSLKRTKKTKASSTPSTVPITSGGSLSSAKSLSSLHQHSTVEVIQSAKSSAHLNEATSPRYQKSSPSGKETWRARLQRHLAKNSSSHHLEKEPTSPPPPLPVLPPTISDKEVVATHSAFFTLPRKRSEPSSLRPPSVHGGIAPPDASSRIRSYSTATLGDKRHTKRSTVWYTHSESDIRLKGRVSFFFKEGNFYLVLLIELGKKRMQCPLNYRVEEKRMTFGMSCRDDI